jgi:hypothetical protein
VDLVTLGRTLGFSFAAGVNLYATVAIVGLAARYGWSSCHPSSTRSTTTSSLASHWRCT